MNKHVFFVDLSNITRDTYPILFNQMKEDKIETWFLPPGYRIYQDNSDHYTGYRIYQDNSDHYTYYRFSNHSHHNIHNTPHAGRALFNTIQDAHKHYQEKNLIEMLNKNARIK